MKPKILLLSLSIAVSTGCAIPKPAPLPPVSVSIPSQEVQDLLIQKTQSSLKDPDSAKFSGYVRLVDNIGACVEVNAKNSFGGYTGFQQAVLMKVGGAGWQVISVKDITRDTCIEALHKTIFSKYR